MFGVLRAPWAPFNLSVALVMVSDTLQILGKQLVSNFKNCMTNVTCQVNSIPLQKPLLTSSCLKLN